MSKNVYDVYKNDELIASSLPSWAIIKLLDRDIQVSRYAAIGRVTKDGYSFRCIGKANKASEDAAWCLLFSIQWTMTVKKLKESGQDLSKYGFCTAHLCDACAKNEDCNQNPENEKISECPIGQFKDSVMYN